MRPEFLLAPSAAAIRAQNSKLSFSEAVRRVRERVLP